MTATVFYDSINQIALLTNTFLNSLGVAADPATVACVITDPADTMVIHSYAGTAPADIVKVSTGVYTLSVPCSPAVTGADGLWGGEWIGTGGVSDVQPVTWRVLPAGTSQLWYIGLDEFKDRLGIADTADDSQAQIAIQSVSQYINEFCGRHFNRIAETRTYQPHNIWLLDIDDLISVSALNLDMNGTGVYSLALTQNVDYQLRYGNNLYNPNVRGVSAARPYRQVQIIQTGNWFPFTWPFTELNRVQIVGVWGWPEVPPPVTQACFMLAADYFKLKDAPFGLAGGEGFGQQRWTGTGNPISANPWISAMLGPYVNPKHKVGV